ncbi:hypothetical protein C8R43DRAFT_943207 [Mycena crocata]|nr:hypothetical protein C8R43DRAFT_943207 [Mycena crocata]
MDENAPLGWMASASGSADLECRVNWERSPQPHADRVEQPSIITSMKIYHSRGTASAGGMQLSTALYSFGQRKRAGIEYHMDEVHHLRWTRAASVQLGPSDERNKLYPSSSCMVVLRLSQDSTSSSISESTRYPRRVTARKPFFVILDADIFRFRISSTFRTASAIFAHINVSMWRDTSLRSFSGWLLADELKQRVPSGICVDLESQPQEMAQGPSPGRTERLSSSSATSFWGATNHKCFSRRKKRAPLFPSSVALKYARTRRGEAPRGSHRGFVIKYNLLQVLGPTWRTVASQALVLQSLSSLPSNTACGQHTSKDPARLNPAPFCDNTKPLIYLLNLGLLCERILQQPVIQMDPDPPVRHIPQKRVAEADTSNPAPKVRLVRATEGEAQELIEQLREANHSLKQQIYESHLKSVEVVAVWETEYNNISNQLNLAQLSPEDVAMLKAELDRLRFDLERIDILEAENEELEDEKERLCAENKKLQTDSPLISELQERLEVQQTLFGNNREEIQAANAKISSLQSSNADLRLQMEALQGKNNYFAQEGRKLEASLESLQMTVAVLVFPMAADIENSVQTQIDGLRKAVMEFVSAEVERRSADNRKLVSEYERQRTILQWTTELFNDVKKDLIQSNNVGNSLREKLMQTNQRYEALHSKHQTLSSAYVAIFSLWRDS